MYEYLAVVFQPNFINRRIYFSELLDLVRFMAMGEFRELKLEAKWSNKVIYHFLFLYAFLLNTGVCRRSNYTALPQLNPDYAIEKV